MKNKADQIRDWPVVDGWHVSVGVSWCVKGSRVQIGDEAQIGDGVRIGAWAWIGDGVQIGYGVRIGDGVRIGAWTQIGAWARIGDGAQIGYGIRIGDEAQIGAWAQIGDGVRIGAKAVDAIDLGYYDGYRKCIAQVNGVAYIGAGCRWFTLDAAIVHWSTKHPHERSLTRCMLEAAKAIAVLKGWKFK